MTPKWFVVPEDLKNNYPAFCYSDEKPDEAKLRETFKHCPTYFPAWLAKVEEMLK